METNLKSNINDYPYENSVKDYCLNNQENAVKDKNMKIKIFVASDSEQKISIFRDNCSNFISDNQNINNPIKLHSLMEPKETFKKRNSSKRSKKSEKNKSKNNQKSLKVFGGDLNEIFNHSGNSLPVVILTLLRTIYCTGSTVLGIYRESGGSIEISKFKNEVNSGEEIDFSDPDYTDIHVLTGVLKCFFRELLIPLIPIKLFTDYLLADSHENKISSVSNNLKSLELCRRQILYTLICHLRDIEKNNKVNLMDFHNLSIVFGPSLVESLRENIYETAELLELIFDNFDGLCEKNEEFMTDVRYLGERTIPIITCCKETKRSNEEYSECVNSSKNSVTSFQNCLVEITSTKRFSSTEVDAVNMRSMLNNANTDPNIRMCKSVELQASDINEDNEKIKNKKKDKLTTKELINSKTILTSPKYKSPRNSSETLHCEVSSLTLVDYRKNLKRVNNEIAIIIRNETPTPPVD